MLKVLARSVMSLYNGAKTRVDYELLWKFEAKAWKYEGCAVEPFILAVVVDVVT